MNSFSIDGVFLLDKDRGHSTAYCARTIAKKAGIQKVGHAGTLDPMATGLAIVLFGKATKASIFFNDLRKKYCGIIKLGIRTTTGDAEGDVIEQRDSNTNKAMLFEIAEKIRNIKKQKPPAFSAVKVAGKPLYKYARDGESIEAKEREISIEKFDIEKIEGNDVYFSAVVSKGTYIRSIAETFGEIAGCGAHLSALRRIAIGGFDVKDATTFDDTIRSIENRSFKSKIIDIASALYFIRKIPVENSDREKISKGIKIPLDTMYIGKGEIFAFAQGKEILAFAECLNYPDEKYRYRRILIAEE